MATPIAIQVKDDSPRGLASLERALAGSDMRNVSLVIVRVESLPEIRSLYGGSCYQEAATRIQRALGKVVHGRGFGARSGPTEYTLVLPNMYRRETVALLSAQLGQPERFDIDAGGEQIELIPEITVDVIGRGESIRDCHARVRAALMKSIVLERARLVSMAKIRDRFVRSGAKGLEDVRMRAAA